MNDWARRSPEVAYSLNPAYCGWLVREAAEGYAGVRPAGLPYPLALLVLPVVLHGPTRAALPRSTATALQPWLKDRPEALLGFAGRAEQLAPVTREAIVFAGARGLLAFTDDGRLVAAGKLARGKAAVLALSESLKATVQKAGLVGKWFAEAGEPADVYQMWNVRP
ncbi:MAG: hypothetical protein K2X87_06525 [Gemmataceae bacterium]|nr:hypothetical protein [Gemmataceae bacterium]